MMSKKNIENISVKIGFVEDESRSVDDKLIDDLFFFGNCFIAIDLKGNRRRIDPRNIIVPNKIHK